MRKILAGMAWSGVVFASGGASAYAWMHGKQPASHAQSRTKAIVSQAKQSDARVILLGDSISEMALLPQLCGKDVLNAGLGGANAAQVKTIAADILPGRKADLVVIAVGVNDAVGQAPTDTSAFTASYRQIITLAKATGARVVAVNVEPVVKANRIFDPKRIEAENRIIASMGVPTIDLWSAMRQPGTEWLPDSYSDDGTHPNPAGYSHWKAAVGKSCEA